MKLSTTQILLGLAAIVVGYLIYKQMTKKADAPTPVAEDINTKPTNVVDVIEQIPSVKANQLPVTIAAPAPAATTAVNSFSEPLGNKAAATPVTKQMLASEISATSAALGAMIEPTVITRSASAKASRFNTSTVADKSARFKN